MRVIAFVLAFGCTAGTHAPPDGGNRPVDAPIAQGDAGCMIRCDGQTAVDCEGTRTACEHYCSTGLGCLACPPRLVYCDEEGRVASCSDDGMTATVLHECAAGEICDRGACADLCNDPDHTGTYAGCEFWAVSTLNSLLGSQPRHFMDFVSLGSDGFHFAVAVANPNESPVDVHVTGRDVDEVHRLAPGAVEAIVLPWIMEISQVDPGGLPTPLTDNGVYRGTSSVLAPGAAYHLESDGPIVAYQFNPLNYADDAHADCQFPEGFDYHCYSYTNDASLLLPVPGLGRRYHAVTRPGMSIYDSCGAGVIDGPQAFVAIVATSDQPTQVSILPNAPLRGGAGSGDLPAGEVATRTLSRGDIWQLVGAPPHTREECAPAPSSKCSAPCTASDLTGTRIDADHPIAVFTGTDCANVPTGVSACDHVEEQILPYEALGRDLVAAPLPRYSPHREPTVLRVVASTDGTMVSFEPAGTHEPIVLDEGQMVDLDQFGPLRVHATQPIDVQQFLVGGDYFWPDVTQSDPSMVTVPPTEQWQREYAILVPSTYDENRVVVAAPESATVLLDGEPLAPPTRALGHAFFESVVQPGQHHLTSDEAFSVVVVGIGAYVSYAYPGGASLHPLNVLE